MGYYDDPEHVREYIKMAEGYDGALLIDALRQHLPDGSTILELGMGPGKDLDLLRQRYQVTGSDVSLVFLDLYREQHPEADLLLLDAATIDTRRRFDGLYSNKALIHLSEPQLQASFARQAEVLKPQGVALHSFWYGERAPEEHQGLWFYYHTEETLSAALCGRFDVLEMQRYREMEDDDSVYLVVQKKNQGARLQTSRT